MVPEIVEQAIRIKMACKHESPLISDAEYCCACARAFQELDTPQEIRQQLPDAETIEQAREKLTPYFSGQQAKYSKDPQMARLLHLLISCRVTGAISREARAFLLC